MNCTLSFFCRFYYLELKNPSPAKARRCLVNLKKLKVLYDDIVYILQGSRVVLRHDQSPKVVKNCFNMFIELPNNNNTPTMCHYFLESLDEL